MPRSVDRRFVLAALAAAAATPTTILPAMARPARLPDGEVVHLGRLRAWLAGPTTRYAHAVLGDNIEAEGFVVERSGDALQFRLGPDAVFEDRRVRLVDIDGDGQPEALIVKAYLDRGAALALYRIGRNGIEPLAESAAIGQPNRWLNPVGVGDFIGNGTRTIAAVVTPHLLGSLRLYRLAGSKLDEVARIDGFTNHIIGSRDLDLGYAYCATNERALRIAIPRLDRKSIAVISFADGVARVVDEVLLPRRVVSLSPPGQVHTWLRLDDGSKTSVPIAGAQCTKGTWG